MLATARNRVRREQTARDLTGLSRAMAGWLERCRSGDVDPEGRYRGQYETQLLAIAAVLTGAADALERDLRGIDLALPSGAFYAECRRRDRALVWLHRLWQYYRSMFAQRERDGPFRPLLEAADEVVWSCFHQVQVRAPALRRRPAPLPFVESEYTPAAISAEAVPYALRRDSELAVLDGYLRTLPIPVLRLPPWCVASPWWLVYVGHEVGHHVQHGLGLVAPFRQGLEAAAQAHDLAKEDARSWGAWGEEIFADVCSLCLMGPWALRALAEAERTSTAELVQRREGYPPAVIRLALLARAAARLGLDSRGALDDLPLAEVAAANPRTMRDWAVIDAAVAVALAPLGGGLGTLADLCYLSSDPPEPAFTLGGKVEQWGQHLRGRRVMAPERRLETARQVAAGSLCAWAAIVLDATSGGQGGAAPGEADPPGEQPDRDTPLDQDTQLDTLAAATTDTIRRSRPEGSRAAVPGPLPTDAGAALVRDLLAAGRRPAAAAG